MIASEKIRFASPRRLLAQNSDEKEFEFKRDRGNERFHRII